MLKRLQQSSRSYEEPWETEVANSHAEWVSGVRVGPGGEGSAQQSCCRSLEGVSAKSSQGGHWFELSLKVHSSCRSEVWGYGGHRIGNQDLVQMVKWADGRTTMWVGPQQWRLDQAEALGTVRRSLTIGPSIHMPRNQITGWWDFARAVLV